MILYPLFIEICGSSISLVSRNKLAGNPYYPVFQREAERSWTLNSSQMNPEEGLLVSIIHAVKTYQSQLTILPAFGWAAGFSGAALAIKAWAWQLTHPANEPLPGVSSYDNQDLLIEDVRSALALGVEKRGKEPRVIVIGALGRCGKGALDLCRAVGIPDDQDHLLKWDLNETQKGGPFSEIVESDSKLRLCPS